LRVTYKGVTAAQHQAIEARLGLAALRQEAALADRDAAVVWASQHGWSRRRIAEAMSMSPAGVHQILAKNTPESISERLDELRTRAQTITASVAPSTTDELLDDDSVAFSMRGAIRPTTLAGLVRPQVGALRDALWQLRKITTWARLPSELRHALEEELVALDEIRARLDDLCSDDELNRPAAKSYWGNWHTS
jgi:hypothetical protein